MKEEGEQHNIQTLDDNGRILGLKHFHGNL
jgi:hypothetical protein